eukprot:SAG11_NODE_289_length_11184_cov_20.648083_14_plen_217_part_00
MVDLLQADYVGIPRQDLLEEPVAAVQPHQAFSGNECETTLPFAVGAQPCDQAGSTRNRARIMVVLALVVTPQVQIRMVFLRGMCNVWFGLVWFAPSARTLNCMTFRICGASSPLHESRAGSCTMDLTVRCRSGGQSRGKFLCETASLPAKESIAPPPACSFVLLSNSDFVGCGLSMPGSTQLQKAFPMIAIGGRERLAAAGTSRRNWHSNEEIECT